MEESSDKSSQIKNVFNNSWGVGLLIGVVYSSHLFGWVTCSISIYMISFSSIQHL